MLALAVSWAQPAFCQSAKELFSQGAQQFQAGNYAASAESFEQGLRKSPKPDPLAYLYLGQAYQLQGKNDQARQAYENAVSLDPSGTAGQKARQRLQALPGASFRDCDVCPEMVVVPPGSFSMGTPPDSTGIERVYGEPMRVVGIKYSFAAGKYEVTNGEWAACVREGACQPAIRHQNDRHPVTDVSWDETQRYVDWLADKTGKRYRLLSEAEWEYAARAGTETARYWGNTLSRACEFANVDNTSFACEDGYPAGTAPVGTFKPNAFGLHDMLGNVQEWVQDCFVSKYRGAPSDGAAHVWIEGCDSRVIRGGGWGAGPAYARSDSRYGVPPWQKSGAAGGFRVARTLLTP